MCYVVAWLHERHQMGVNQRGEAMKSTRRHHGATVKGDKTLAELAEQFPTQSTEGEQHLLARAADVCGGTTPTSDPPDLTVLHAKIGPLALEYDC